MKVLFISSWYPVVKSPLKGIFIQKHAEAIRKAGIEIEVLAFSISYSKKIFEKKKYNYINSEGLITHVIEINSRFYKWYYVNLFFQYRLLNDYFKRVIKPAFSPDVIHSNVLFPAGVLGYWLSRKEKLPHIITEHWSKVPKFMRRSLFSLEGKNAYNKAKRITVVSEFLKERIAPYIENERKIIVVPNVVEPSVFVFRPKMQPDPVTIFTCVATWTGVKRPDLIFNSLQQISFERPVILNVVGNGILLEKLKAKKWHFPVIYHGNRNSDEIASILQSSHFFLHASDIETFSVVTAEALLTGTPVLVSKTGALPEFLDGSNGIACENTVEDWVKGLRMVMSSSYKYGEISERANRFSSNVIGEAFGKIYKQVLL